ncbi:hypothetical protein AB0H71_18975 [Nocardia sp. NPDC050697]|uniref:hypothetical protein n=1 Tax=Nocardia sp. NPDC050697 TaxID=3155158 RepID=UPI0033C86AF4
MATTWFVRLGLGDQVAVLADPAAPLSPGLVAAVWSATEPVVVPLRPGDETSTAYRLDPAIVIMLTRRRDRLQHWWSELQPDQQARLLEHRHDWLPESYRHILADAEGVLTQSTCPETGATRLRGSPLTRVFLEWQARRAAAAP